MNAKAYVLEAGDYKISTRSNSHDVIDEKTYTVDATQTFNTADNTHDGDKVVATNQFDDAKGDVTYLSRAGRFVNLAEATAAPTNFEMSEANKAKFLATSNYDAAAAAILALLGLELVAIRRYRARKAQAVITVESAASIDEAGADKAEK